MASGWASACGSSWAARRPLGSVGEYGWGGAYGTYFFIDPDEDLIGILMIQFIPYAHLNLRPEFQNMVNQAIVD